jgi:hypothetical protein
MTVALSVKCLFPHETVSCGLRLIVNHFDIYMAFVEPLFVEPLLNIKSEVYCISSPVCNMGKLTC